MHTQAGPAVRSCVKVSESVVSIPTYGPLGRDAWPNIFFKTQWYAPFYPLHRYIHPAGPKHEQSYVTVTLENEFVRVVVLPELGGHVWQMYDKACGEHLVYNNEVVKPTRIGFRTAWCSMGIEFNFPVAHSLQSVDPLPYKIERHEDGSASVLTWHRDRPRRIEMILSLTLRPGRRDLAVRASMYNPSPVRRPYDYWTNVAISARPETQYVYPTKWMQAHGGRKVYAWPIVNGDDMRFQPNYQKTVSFFAWEPEPPFFGCWWSDTDNGLAHVADPKCCPGKKLFNWGKRASAWVTAVTDESGPYAELQAGRFATQADYQWLAPGQEDVLEEAWYGYHGLGGLSWAGRDLAMHVTSDGGEGKPAKRVSLALHAVGDIPGATVSVTADGKVVLREKTDLAASGPARREVELPAAATQKIGVEVIDADGNVVGSYSQSLRPAGKAHKPKAPAEKWENMFASLEDKDAKTRSRIGETAELNTLWPRAREAYEAALAADPNCAEALLGLGSVCLRSARFDEAASHGRKLMESGQKAWKQAGAYLVGVAELSGGRVDDAVAALRVAAKHSQIGAMASLYLAMALARQGKTQEALRIVEAVRGPVASMPVTQWVKAALAGDAFAADPTSGWAIADPAERLDLACERAIWAMRMGMAGLGERILDNFEQQGAGVRGQGLGDGDGGSGNDRTEDCGLRTEGRQQQQTDDAETRGRGDAGKAGLGSRVSGLGNNNNNAGTVGEPLAWYLKAYLQHLQGKEDLARESLGRAAGMVRNLNQPTHPEWTAVLHWALQTNPSDRKPHSYLAPLEYWLTQPEQALQHWQALVRHDAADDATHYGLAVALWEAKGDRQSAAKILAEALGKQPKHERLYLILDDILVEENDSQTRGYWLARAQENCGRTDYIAERTSHWLTNQQRWREAIDLLTEHKFGPSHGLFIRRRMWLLAHHRLALKCLEAGDYAKAIEYGTAGATPPASLGEDDMTMPFASPVLLAAAEACEKLGQKARAKQLLQQALDLATAGHMHPPYTEVHRARVLLKLGKKAAGEKLLQEVLNEVLPRLEDSRKGLNKAHFHFLYALVLETRGQAEKARQHYAEAEKLGLQWANLVGYGVQWGFN